MTTKKVAYPIGLKIVDIRWMTDEEREKEGWEKARSNNTAVLVLNDDSIVYASCDPEGNGSGFLFGCTKDDEHIYVMPLDKEELV